MRQFIHVTAIITLIIGYAFAFLVAFWLFYPYKVIEYKDQVLPLVNSKLAPGDTIEIRHRFCKFIDVPVDANIEISDSIIYKLPVLMGKSQPGCYDRISRAYKVPETMLPGEKGRLHYYLQYKVNPIRTVYYDLYTQEFTVIAPKSQ